ncbi:MAG: precorrin-6y C5,15-methyltransferase (decarboxylating) subunit CbiE [Chromatiales bacterium]|nr:precorrin-6y C5,15-methyltransferase (decarboxylating) subunit CbiE [Chromatiales bacterium]
MSDRCRIIGVLDNGSEGLTRSALQHIGEADLVLGGSRTLALLSDSYKAGVELRDISGKFAQAPGWIDEALKLGQRVVVLATGDPLCHGIGRYLINKLGAERCAVLPNLSILQLAFARLGVAWEGVKICSVHSRDAGEWQPGSGPEHGLYKLLQSIRQHSLLAIFTSPDNGPGRIARMLQSEGLTEGVELAVLERLLQPEECIHAFMSVEETLSRAFAEPNFVILRRTLNRHSKPLFGLGNEHYIQRKPGKGLITKREVRVVSLARLNLSVDSVVWDIGAGSGSVGLEAARLCSAGHVYAVEKNPDDFAIAAENRRRFGVSNYTLIHAEAPAEVDRWPDPDAVFIGGSGGRLSVLIELSLQRLNPGGWLVMNFVTLENLNSAMTLLKQLNVTWDVTQIQIACSSPILDMQRLRAENPVWIVSAQRSRG